MLVFKGKVPIVSHDDVIARLGHDKNCLLRPGALCGGLILMMRPAIFFAEEVAV